MIAFTKAHTYFKNLNTELLGLSVDSNSSHEVYQKLQTKVRQAITCDLIRHYINKKLQKFNSNIIIEMKR